MRAEYRNGNVVATCPECGVPSTFENRDASREFGTVIRNGSHKFGAFVFERTLYILMRCASCGRGGIATIHDNGRVPDGTLEEFLPVSVALAELPKGVPTGIIAEFREAERCAAFGAWRGASALLRSTLEKTLKVNGYEKGNLEHKIDTAADDGVITEARRKRAHAEVRVLGNDVLHDEWRGVSEEDVEASHHYVQRLLEDFYDDRESVEAALRAKGRLGPDPD